MMQTVMLVAMHAGIKIKRKISQVSLDYVVKLWQPFAEEYEIPSLTAVIDRIVAGSSGGSRICDRRGHARENFATTPHNA